MSERSVACAGTFGELLRRKLALSYRHVQSPRATHDAQQAHLPPTWASRWCDRPTGLPGDRGCQATTRQIDGGWEIIQRMAVPPPSNQPDHEVLAGIVERVTFHNPETGFCVLRVKARGHRDLATIVGHAATISAGEWITASGDWVNDRTHGQQFKARFMRTSAPSSVEGIEKYLASGMIRGIGPVYARKMVKAFGEKVFDIIGAR